MSGVSMPVTRPTGRGLLVGSPAARAEAAEWLNRLGCQCLELDDPYAAMAELSQRPLAYSAIVLSLGALFKEELQIIPVIKRRFVHVDIWLARTEGRQTAVDEAMQLGADGYVAEDGLHRLPSPEVAAESGATGTTMAAPEPGVSLQASARLDDLRISEPVLTAEELRMLLDDSPPATSA